MVAAVAIRQQVQLGIGQAGLPLGSLVYVRQGRRENCAFAYDVAWLTHPERFNVSADLQLVAGHQPHKAASAHDSVFHGAIADTMPDAWGRRVIARDHAKLRIPRDGGHDSRLMADSIPLSCRTPFHAEGGQHSIAMADTSAVF